MHTKFMEDITIFLVAWHGEMEVGRFANEQN